MNSDVISIVIAALSGLGGILGGAFWIKKWIGEVDSGMRDLFKITSELKLHMELSKELAARTEGAQGQIQKAILESNAELGRLTGKINALWNLLDKYFEPEVKLRTSDVLSKLK